MVPVRWSPASASAEQLRKTTSIICRKWPSWSKKRLEKSLCNLGDCGMRIAECGMRNADCGMRIADCGFVNVYLVQYNIHCYHSAFRIPHSREFVPDRFLP